MAAHRGHARSLGAKDKIDEAKKRFLSYYQFAEYAPSEFEEQVFRAVFSRFEDKAEVTLSPKEISEIISVEYFNPKHDSRQRAAMVGRAIKKFNIASTFDKKQSGTGFQFLFRKEKVEKTYQAYTKTDIEPPQPPPPDENQDSEASF